MPRTLTSAEHPGTAVEWDGLLYEVREAEPQADGGMRYVLAPWEERHVVRRAERYDALTEEIRAGDQRDRRRDVVQRRLSILFAPVLGLLPGETQKKMERDFGAPAIAMTIASALPLFLVGFLGVFGALARLARAGNVLPVWIAPPAPIAVYLFIESALRLGSAVAAGEPMGILAAELVAAFAAKPASAGRTPRAEPVAEEAHDRELFGVLEPVLALLPRGDQEVLVRRFGFDALRRGRATAAVLLALAVLNSAVSVSAFGSKESVAAGFLWSLPALYLSLEQIARWRSFARGAPAGSVLGILVRPFARPLLG
ncbi:MAG TPA: hypothetical protein VFA98_11040 [Thermoanaerobaculia bacterium]|nr:hypothetical protein [Thermoanaerobaculia bacterium]